MIRFNLYLAPLLLTILVTPCRSLGQCVAYPGVPDVMCAPGAGLNEDSEAISPPEIVPPVYECSDRVPVRSFVRGATIRVYRRDAVSGAVSLWGSSVGAAPWGHTVVGSSALSEGDTLWATQEMDGPESNPSNEIVASLLGEPRPPFIDPVPVYECGRALGLRSVPVGSIVNIEHDEVGNLMNGPAASAWTGDVIAPLPSYASLTPETNTMTGSYELCGQVGGPSTPESIWPEPGEMMAPEIEGSAVYEGQEYVLVRGTPFGSLISLRSEALDSVGEGVNWWGNDGRAKPVELSTLPTEGDALYASYSLCSDSEESGGTPVLPCSALPPPRFRVPQVGDSHIWLDEAVAGARIVVFAENAAGVEEIGDASTSGLAGSSIRLTRRVRLGETLRLVQRLGTCQSEFASFHTVVCRRTQPLELADAGPHAVGTADFELGLSGQGWRISGRTYFPTNDELAPNEVIPYGGALPTIFMMHGQRASHSCTFGSEICPEVGDCFGTLCARAAEEVCSEFDAASYPEIRSYEGYGVAGELLASHGFVVVSINANDVCNGSFANVNERVELFRAHFEAWFSSDFSEDPSVGHLAGRLDAGRVIVAGHSRGGEAAAIAGNDPGVGIGVLGVVAVAPTVMLGGTSSANVPIVVAIGTRDGDTGVVGQRLYDQSISAEWRTAMYITGANHNNWNRQWGNDDAAGAGGANPLSDLAQERLLGEILLASAEQFLSAVPPTMQAGYSAWLAGVANLASYETTVTYGTRHDLVWNEYSGTGANALGGTSVLSGFYDVQASECRLGAWVQPEAFMGKSAAVWARWSGGGSTIDEDLPGGVDDSSYEWVSVRFSQVPLPEKTDSVSAIPVTMSAADDSGGVYPISLEASASLVPAIYGFDYPYDLTDENGVSRSPEALGRWGTIRFPLACIIGEGRVPNGDSLRGISFSLDAGEGWVAVDDLVFQ